jgi:hypothetical protein
MLLLAVNSYANTSTQANLPDNLVDDISDFFSTDGIVVSADYYPTAETGRQMLETQTKAGGVNRLGHIPVLTPTDMQPVVRMNRDAYYSKGIIDVSQGATITLPELPDGRYISMQPVTVDHRPQPMSYGGGRYSLATHIGDHMLVIIRLDSSFTPEQANNYQQQITIEANSQKLFSTAPVQAESFYQTENALKAKIMTLIQQEGPIKLSTTLFTSPTNETRGDYKPEINQVAAAVGWGGALAKDNIYETSTNYPANGCYEMSFEDPGNKHFWSITVYNKKGFMFNDNANVNSYKATPNADGTYSVSFGCANKSLNQLPIDNESGVFNITVRHYGPSDRVLKDGYRLVPLLKKVDWYQ